VAQQPELLVCGSTEVRRSSLGPRLPKPSGHGRLAAREALLVSPFNVKWRFSAPAGDVEESKLYLFSVIMPAKCVSSISPRFHSRRLAFCFLPLAAILESHHFFFVVLEIKLRKIGKKNSFCSWGLVLYHLNNTQPFHYFGYFLVFFSRTGHGLILLPMASCVAGIKA
jgi:hypothetical protein